MATELDTLTGIPARYRHVLTDQLQLTTCRDLVLADRTAILAAIRAAKKRATLEQIAQWQDDARRYHHARLENPTDPWDTTASFVVCFQQRQRPDQSFERRIEVEHTEIEPEQAPATHSNWDCHWVCTWMGERLALPTLTASPPTTGPAALDPATNAPGPPTVTRTRPQLTFTAVQVTDATGTHDLTHPTSPLRLRSPAQLTITLANPPPADAHIAIHERTPHQPGRTLVEQPLTHRNVTLDLATLTTGPHALTLVAWTPTDATDPAIIQLPHLHIDEPVR